MYRLPFNMFNTLDIILVQIYKEATKGQFSHLFMNLAQECDTNVKYLSHLFDNIGRVNVYIVEGQRYWKEVGYGNFDAISFKNNNNEQMIHLCHIMGGITITLYLNQD